MLVVHCFTRAFVHGVTWLTYRTGFGQFVIHSSFWTETASWTDWGWAVNY